MATEQEISVLKREWLEDPHWDLESTDGFADHVDELKAFRLAQQQRWREQHTERMLTKASELGVPGNVKLAEYVVLLERRVAKLEESLPGN
ncbi:hypothetical protein [Burkholderia sp. MBR-1]|uniref:hypothetical protein n=1 Tax=Burkholderia sp. MBR-1 TaxID=2732364 RepID=UPI0015EE51D1|nr:hypothetical protein [Burkholderia sp. MBR-1]QMI49700.1 hypothetical protein MBR110_29900 [Burkholderia sp. MBR-1]